MNMGAYSYVSPRMDTVLKSLNRPAGTVFYAGRAPSASTATGFHDMHNKEQLDLIHAALKV